jgi:hypothetical protein
LTLERAPSLTMVTPTSATIWTRGTSYPIEWSSTGTIGTLVLTLKKSGMADIVLSSNENNDGTYTISSVTTTSLTASSGYTLVLADGSVSVTSSSFTVVNAPPPKSITIQTPNLCVQSSLCSISFSKTGGVTTVRLSYSGASSGIVMSMTESSPYSWLIPSNLLPGTYYITGTDTNDAGVQGVSSSFTVEAAPKLTIQLPISSTKWIHGNVGSIVWTKEGSMSDTITISIMKSGMNTINYDTDNDGNYDVTSSIVSTLPVGNGYTVRLSIDSISVSSQAFSVGLPDGIVVGLMPTNGCVAGQDCSIPWTAQGTVTTVRINHVRMSGSMTSTVLSSSTSTNP